MGNQICLTETKLQHYAQGSPDTKWKREELKSGSTYQDDKENFFKCYQAGPSLPQYKNKLATSKWESAINELSSIQIINENDTAKFIYQNNTDFDQLVMLGPPAYLRWSTWKVLLLNEKTLISYERMLGMTCLEESAINKDIDRTLINHKLFQNQHFSQDQLRRVLQAIANTVPSMGYCQGMNFLAALLLVVSGCDEMYSYQCLLNMLISEKHLLYFCYIDEMPLHFFIVKLTHIFIKKKFPELSQNLRNVSDAFWLSKMIFSLFLYVFKLDDCVRAWDYLLSRGMIRGITELILGLIENTYDQLIKYTIEDFGLNFQGSDTSNLKFNIGEVIYSAKQNNSVKREEVAKLARIMKNKQSNSLLLDLLSKYNDRLGYKKRVKIIMDNLINQPN